MINSPANLRYFKYPRTYHLPWSPGATQDDKIIASIEYFCGKEVIVTEKLDGENSSIYCGHTHARAIDSAHHPSRAWIKDLWGRIRHKIPQGWRICGENMYAKHSILYHSLTTYFYVFAVYDEANICLSWDDTVLVSAELELETVPVLYRGMWDEKAIKACWTGKSVFNGEQEGYVVRSVSAFPHTKVFMDCVAKYVRAGHVDLGSQHWMSQVVVPNFLK